MSGSESDRSEPDLDAPERDGWKLVAKVPSRPVASLIEGLLEGAGIEAELESQLFTQEPVALGLLGMIKIWVPIERYDEARTILEESSLEEGSLEEGSLEEGSLEEGQDGPEAGESMAADSD